MDSGKAQSHRDGEVSPVFKENGYFRIFASQIFGLPPAFGPPS